MYLGYFPCTHYLKEKKILKSELYVSGRVFGGETHPVEKLLAPAVCANVFQVSRRAAAKAVIADRCSWFSGKCSAPSSNQRQKNENTQNWANVSDTAKTVEIVKEYIPLGLNLIPYKVQEVMSLHGWVGGLHHLLYVWGSPAAEWIWWPINPDAEMMWCRRICKSARETSTQHIVMVWTHKNETYF